MRTLHNVAIHKYIAFIQSAQYITDWVQIPTKTEMDLWRDENTPGWRVDFKVVTKVIVTPCPMEKKEWKKKSCQI